jgi:hypothetical protein
VPEAQACVPIIAVSLYLQSVLPASSGAAAQKEDASRTAGPPAPGSAAVARLDCLELLAVNGQFGHTLEIMDALKATLRDEVGLNAQQCECFGVTSKHFSCR